jgi:hypothetical protein
VNSGRRRKSQTSSLAPEWGGIRIEEKKEINQTIISNRSILKIYLSILNTSVVSKKPLN